VGTQVVDGGYNCVFGTNVYVDGMETDDGRNHGHEELGVTV